MTANGVVEESPVGQAWPLIVTRYYWQVVALPVGPAHTNSDRKPKPTSVLQTKNQSAIVNCESIIGITRETNIELSVSAEIEPNARWVAACSHKHPMASD